MIHPKLRKHFFIAALRYRYQNGTAYHFLVALKARVANFNIFS